MKKPVMLIAMMLAAGILMFQSAAEIAAFFSEIAAGN